MLEEKAERYGKRVVQVDRWFPSSKMCSDSGHIVPALPSQIREWTCPSRECVYDRDMNAANNILAVGQTIAAHGAGVRAASPVGEEASRL